MIDGFVKSQDLTPSHKDHRVNILILNEFFLRVLSAFVRKYSFYEFIMIDELEKSPLIFYFNEEKPLRRSCNSGVSTVSRFQNTFEITRCYFTKADTNKCADYISNHES